MTADPFPLLLPPTNRRPPPLKIIGTTTKARFTQNSLTRYWFYVRAVGATGQSVMSDPAIGGGA